MSGPLPVWGPRFGFMFGYCVSISFSFLIIVYGLKFDMAKGAHSINAPSTASSSASCGAVAEAESEGEGDSEANDPNKESYLNFTVYFGSMSTASKWLVSVILALIQDMVNRFA